jgi:hypothetical protein
LEAGSLVRGQEVIYVAEGSKPICSSKVNGKCAERAQRHTQRDPLLLDPAEPRSLM